MLLNSGQLLSGMALNCSNPSVAQLHTKKSVLAGKPALERTPDVAGNESFRRIADQLVKIAEARAKEYAHEPV